MDLVSLAFIFFIVADPIGNIPVIAALLKDFPLKKQRKIMVRESILALGFAIGFQFLGEPFLKMFHIADYNVSIAGGVLLFVIGIHMIFPKEVEEEKKPPKEPFFVPIAVPLVSGGALLSSILLYSSLIGNPWMITGALLLAWCGVAPILIAAPYLKKILKESGLQALEQLMGMILIFISIQLLVDGLSLFVVE